MSEAGSAKEEQVKEDAWAARCLLRACRAATLSTVWQGQPFAALVTPATTGSGEILLLLSDLSEHTRHLRAEPRCNLLVVGAPVEANPQTAPRVSISGTAAVARDQALLERYLSVHPYAELYAGFGDFNLWRITPVSARFVGGFARAATLGAADLLADATVAARITAAAAPLLTSAPVWLDHVAARAGLGPKWQLAGLDLDGVDLVRGEESVRLSFPRPVAAGEVLEEFLASWAK